VVVSAILVTTVSGGVLRQMVQSVPSAAMAATLAAMATAAASRVGVFLSGYCGIIDNLTN